MGKKNEIKLIKDALAGDDIAFNILVRKHQKGIHTFVWKKINDFHFAEEITQDTFIKAYTNLSTLKDLSQFPRWLYTIASRLCINWIQRNKPPIPSLEDTPASEIEQSSYKHYVLEEREREAIEHRYQRIENLLEKLPEKEQRVITLYYLDEMTTKEIANLLGVSVNTITSRLQRARKRLQEDMHS